MDGFDRTDCLLITRDVRISRTCRDERTRRSVEVATSGLDRTERLCGSQGRILGRKFRFAPKFPDRLNVAPGIDLSQDLATDEAVPLPLVVK